MHTAALGAATARFLEGERVYLRDVQLADANDDYYRWMNDPEVTRYLESRFFPNSLESIREYVRAKQTDRANVFLAICERATERHVGNIKLGPIDWIHRRADLGLMIGAKDCWGKGYATEAIRLVTQYAFDTLNLHKVTAGVYAPNVGSLRAFLKCGYQHEGTKRAHYFCEGRYVDAIALGIVRPD